MQTLKLQLKTLVQNEILRRERTKSQCSLFSGQMTQIGDQRNTNESQGYLQLGTTKKIRSKLSVHEAEQQDQQAERQDQQFQHIKNLLSKKQLTEVSSGMKPATDNFWKENIPKVNIRKLSLPNQTQEEVQGRVRKVRAQGVYSKDNQILKTQPMMLVHKTPDTLKMSRSEKVLQGQENLMTQNAINFYNLQKNQRSNTQDDQSASTGITPTSKKLNEKQGSNQWKRSKTIDERISLVKIQCLKEVLVKYKHQRSKTMQTSNIQEADFKIKLKKIQCDKPGKKQKIITMKSSPNIFVNKKQVGIISKVFVQ